MKFDNLSNDVRSGQTARSIGAGAYLRTRWHQWLIGSGGVKAVSLMPRPAEPGSREDASAGEASSANRKPENAAVRNAQNCTFEVF
jgi:hypothetical protein